MNEQRRAAELGIDERTYTEPKLVVHGQVPDLTAGGAGRTPDVGATGSFLPNDDPTPV